MATPEYYSISVYGTKDIAKRYERIHFSDEIGQYVHDLDSSAIARNASSNYEVVADAPVGAGLANANEEGR